VEHLNSSYSVQVSLMEVSRHESEFRWFEAAKTYEQIIKATLPEGATAADLFHRIAHCYDLASRQSENTSTFRRLRQLAVDAYQKAAEFYETDDSTKNTGKSLLCLANAQYVKNWLGLNAIEKADALEACLELGEKALWTFKQAKDQLNYGKTLNLLAICANDLQKITASATEKEKLVKTGLSRATEAVSVLSEFKDDDLIVALGFTCILSTVLLEMGIPTDERKDLCTKCRNNSNKATQLARESGNPYSMALALWASSLSAFYFEEKIEERISFKEPNEMLQQASKTRDKYLQGLAFYLLAYIQFEEIQEEASPEKKKKRYEDTIKYSEDARRWLQMVGQDADAAFIWYCRPECYSYLAREFAIAPSEKQAFLKKAVEVGEKGLQYAISSGSPDALEANLHALSKAHYYRSKLESRHDRKTKLLRKALKYRRDEIKSTKTAFSSNYWYIGVGLVYSAQIEADLARLEKNKRKKVSFFEDAISHMESGVSNCKRQLEYGAHPPLITHIAEYEDTFGELLEELFSLTEDKRTLARANEIYYDSAMSFIKVSLPMKVAESFWKIAENQEATGEFEKASCSFQNASEHYKLAAQKIPQLNDFYLDYSVYMRAWSEIEKAKLSHLNEKYSSARQHYRKSSNLLKKSKQWNYIASNFYAWSLLEHAEDLSRKEKSQEAISAFKQALECLQESKQTLRASIGKMHNEDERKSIERLVKSSETRERFDQGRIVVEEAKLLDEQGDPTASSEKYGSAASIFMNLLQSNPEQAGTEVTLLFYLCQAWQKMTAAEATVSPSLYGEAAELFRQAKEHSSNESANLLALANSNFCLALQAGTEFEVSRNMYMYAEAGKYMDAAANYYLKAGLITSSEYAKATQRVLDAYVFMSSGKKESDPKQSAKYYLMAEKVLKSSAESYTKAKHPQKASHVNQLLRKVKEEKELALSLSEILHSPTITSPTSGFATLGVGEERAVGLERFAHANIQVKLVRLGDKVEIGKDFDLIIQVINVGKEPVLLTKIEGIVSAGLQLVSQPDYSHFENDTLIFKGKQLRPMETGELKVVLKPYMRGDYRIEPGINCVDELGNGLFYHPEALMLNVLAVTLAGRITTGYSGLDDLLLGGIPENFAVVLMSPSSNERELLINKFLDAGAENHETTFYLTNDLRSARDFAKEGAANFFLFVFAPSSGEFIGTSSNVFRLNGVENLTEIDICLTKALRGLNPVSGCHRRAFIKILSDVLLQHHAVLTQKWLNGLLPELRSRGFTTIAVINPKMHPIEEVQAIVDQFEGEIEIFERQMEKDIGQFLRIRKLIGQRYLKNELLLPKE